MKILGIIDTNNEYLNKTSRRISFHQLSVVLEALADQQFHLAAETGTVQQRVLSLSPL